MRINGPSIDNERNIENKRQRWFKRALHLFKARLMPYFYLEDKQQPQEYKRILTDDAVLWHSDLQRNGDIPS